jgi:hypothetical protein
MSHTPTSHLLTAIWRELGGRPEIAESVELAGSGDLPSVFAVSDFAAAAVGAGGAAIAELVGTRFGELPRVAVSRRLSSLWFGWSIRPDGWTLPAAWDPIAGDYATADGWIRLHTNAPHHRDAALSVLGAATSKEQVARVVAGWNADALESAVIESGGCAATMRSIDAWKLHTQGQSVSAEPLLTIHATSDLGDSAWSPTRERPLQGLRVLDLTRVLAGPVATRFLAGFGADVLRIDPPGWDEPGVVPEVTLGKRCARLDLRDASGREQFRKLLRGADVLVHGYRADALDKLGLDARTRREIRPGLIDVSLNAYGWSGPWRNRRGFDSLVQMSSGIADAGMRMLGKDRPTPLPVQALDHATGYLMAAAAVRGVTHRLSSGHGFEARASLARTAELLISAPRGRTAASLASAANGDWSEEIERTAFGPAHRLRAPVQIGQASMRWGRPAVRLGSSSPEW